MTTRRTLRLALVSAAPTPALRAARFPDDEGLDADGLRRTATAARTLATGALPGRARVLVDDSARARQTARLLGLAARAGEAGVQIDAALRDLDVGSWRGRNLGEIPTAELQRWHAEPAMAPPGGESREDLLARVGAWLAGLAAQSEHVIAVSHPAVVRAVLLTVLRCPPEIFWRIDVAPLTATLLHRHALEPELAPAPNPDSASVPAPALALNSDSTSAVGSHPGSRPEPAWTLTHACRPL